MDIKGKDNSAPELNWRNKPRRQFTATERLAMVQECLAAGATVAEVAQRNRINANLLFNWKRRYERGQLPAPAASTALVPVRVVKAKRKPAKRAAARPTPAEPAGAIEIEISGARIFLHGTVSEANLAAVLRAIASR